MSRLILFFKFFLDGGGGGVMTNEGLLIIGI